MADDLRKQRAVALEEKKRRLEELKARRSTRTSVVDSSSADGSAAAGSNLNEYIDELLSSVSPAAVAVVETATEELTETAAKHDIHNDTEILDSVSVIAEVAPADKTCLLSKKNVETFAISTQTEIEDFPLTENEEEDKKKSFEEKEEKKVNNDKKTQNITEEEIAADKFTPKLLSAAQLSETISSAPFSNFFTSASKKVERLLGAPVLADLLIDVDYVRETDEEAELLKDNLAEKKVRSTSSLILARVEFECTQWTHCRDCTDLDWSPIHRELMLASYHMPNSANSACFGSSAVSAIRPDDTSSASLVPRSGELLSDGLALIWSLAMPSRPEHIFTCGSPVLSTRFHPTEHHLVIGGCHSGQLVVWDIRAGRLPVQRSSLPTVSNSLRGHAHPICSMEIVEGGSGLVTAATDGRLNFWSLANLRDPAESVLIDGNVSTLAVAPESNSIVCGDESGSLHTLTASTSESSSSTVARTPGAVVVSSSRRTIRKFDVGEEGQGHYGMVTGLSTKVLADSAGMPSSSRRLSKGFVRGEGGLILTCGVDWTTKLWAPAYSDKPLFSLLSHSYDYMCDVRWSPVHPSVFATASGNGTLGLWNLATSLDEPITGSSGIVIDVVVSEGSVPRGLNKIKWSLDGRRIVVACTDKLHVLGMSEEVWRPNGDEEARMMSNLRARGLLDEE